MEDWKGLAVTAEDLEQINGLAKAELSAEQDRKSVV